MWGGANQTHNENKTAKRILFLPHIFPIMSGGDDRRDMWCRREANVKLSDTVRIISYSAAIPAHEVRERRIRAMEGECAQVASVLHSLPQNPPAS